MIPEIGSIIRTARKEKGLTQKELASRLGVSTGAVQQWELGVRNPRLPMLLQIENTLQIALLNDKSSRDELEAELQEFEGENRDRLLAIFTMKNPLFIEALNTVGITIRLTDREIYAEWEDESFRLTMNDIEELHEQMQYHFFESIQRIWSIPIADEYQPTAPTEPLPEDEQGKSSTTQEKPPEGQIDPKDGK